MVKNTPPEKKEPAKKHSARCSLCPPERQYVKGNYGYHVHTYHPGISGVYFYRANGSSFRVKPLLRRGQKEKAEASGTTTRSLQEPPEAPKDLQKPPEASDLSLQIQNLESQLKAVKVERDQFKSQASYMKKVWAERALLDLAVHGWCSKVCMGDQRRRCPSCAEVTEDMISRQVSNYFDLDSTVKFKGGPNLDGFFATARRL